MTKSHLVVGLGKTGLSVLDFLAQNALPTCAYDTRDVVPGIEQIEKKYPNTPLYLGQFPHSLFDDIEDVIVSPGVNLEEDIIQAAFKHGLNVIGDIELFARHVKKPVIAVTGTNGKSTVVSMVCEILTEAGLTVALAGNIGKPALASLSEDADVYVLELSSFQLETTASLRPVVAALLNVTEDHIDRHKTFEAYRQAKKRIFLNSSVQIYNADDKNTPPDLKANARRFSLYQETMSDYWLNDKDEPQLLMKGNEAFLSLDTLNVSNRFEIQNILASSAIVDAFGVDLSHVAKAMSHFNGLRHRCELVDELNGVRWINDSKGTNVGATKAAILGIGPYLAGKIVWIAGGVGKNADFSPLAIPVQRYARCAILMGEDKSIIADALTDVNVYFVSTLASAVKQARELAKPGDCVLLSPACASFDMFSNFEERGDSFAREVLHGRST